MRILILSVALILSACGGSNSDGSSKSTYSSCKITSSEAMFSSDRENDLNQCWDADGDGYESQGDALQWCELQTTEYLSENYFFGHSIEYAIESTNCN